MTQNGKSHARYRLITWVAREVEKGSGGHLLKAFLPRHAAGASHPSMTGSGLSAAKQRNSLWTICPMPDDCGRRM
jgi:hypothetical protein